MRKLLATGCDECNLDLALAYIQASKAFGYIGVKEYARIPEPRPIMRFEGENIRGSGIQAFAIVVGSPGWMFRNHLVPNLTHRKMIPILCPCGSRETMVELWEGIVTLDWENPVMSANALLRMLRH